MILASGIVVRRLWRWRQCDLARGFTQHRDRRFWENWSEQRFERSGAYALAGALVPVKIDFDRGTYEEPNVWVSYAA